MGRRGMSECGVALVHAHVGGRLMVSKDGHYQPKGQVTLQEVTLAGLKAVPEHRFAVLTSGSPEYTPYLRPSTAQRIVLLPSEAFVGAPPWWLSVASSGLVPEHPLE